MATADVRNSIVCFHHHRNPLGGVRMMKTSRTATQLSRSSLPTLPPGCPRPYRSTARTHRGTSDHFAPPSPPWSWATVSAGKRCEKIWGGSWGSERRCNREVRLLRGGDHDRRGGLDPLRAATEVRSVPQRP